MHKQRLAARATERGKGFIANGRKAARFGLYPQHPLPTAKCPVTRFDAQVLSFVGKQSAWRAMVKLGVLVIGVAQTRLDALQPPRQLAHLPFQRIAGGFHADRHLVFGHGTVLTLVSVD